MDVGCLSHFLRNVEVVVSFCLLSRYISSDIISVDYLSKSIEMVCNSDTIYSIEDEGGNSNSLWRQSSESSKP